MCGWFFPLVLAPTSTWRRSLQICKFPYSFNNSVIFQPPASALLLLAVNMIDRATRPFKSYNIISSLRHSHKGLSTTFRKSNFKTGSLKHSIMLCIWTCFSVWSDRPPWHPCSDLELFTSLRKHWSYSDPPPQQQTYTMACRPGLFSSSSVGGILFYGSQPTRSK